MPAWEQFPGPQNIGLCDFDTGIGVWLGDDGATYSHESLSQAHALGIRWGAMLNMGKELGDAGGWSRSETIQLMLKIGIYPINRVWPDKGWSSVTPTRAGLLTYSLKRNFAEAGYPNATPYVQILNEPNLTVEWSDRNDPIPDGAPELVARQWRPAAQAVMDAGGIPLTTPLSPGGNYNDWVFFVRFCQELKRLGVIKEWMERCAIAIHNYTDNKPLDWGHGSYRKWSKLDFHNPGWRDVVNAPPPDYGDTQGFCMYEWYHDACLDILGAECSVMSTEGGTYPGNHGILYRDPIDAGLHASYTTSQMALMMGDRVTDRAVLNDTSLTVPAYYRNTAFWTWGFQPGWSAGNIRVLPETLKRMAGMQIHPRKQAPIVIEPPAKQFVWELRFESDAPKAKALGLDPGDPVEKAHAIIGDATRYLIRQKGTKRTLYYWSDSDETTVSI